MSGIRGYAEGTFILACATTCWCVCGMIETGAAVSGFAPVEEQTKASLRDIQRQFSLSLWTPMGRGYGDDATRGLFSLPARLSERCEYNSPDP